MNKEGALSPTSFDKNSQRQYSLAIVAIFLATLSIFMISQIGSIQTQLAVAQRQASQDSLTLSENQSLLNGISYQNDNVTFWHHIATVNGIQMHYVIGGQGEPIVLLHGWPQTWYEWRHIMPSLAKNYTVIAPDLRGLGDSSKPVTGYDGRTTAEDIYQLVSKLGFKKLFLVGHDFGVQVAYSYAAAHPNEVSRLVILDVPIPGIGPGENITGLWWAQFHIVRDIPEMLVDGHEREYLTWFYRHTCNPEAITQEDIDEYVSHYSAPGGMRAGFEYYRALLDDVKQNIESSKIKLPMPVLALGGECSFGTAALESLRLLATDVHGGLVPDSGHWIAEEQPQFLVDQLFNFFGNGTNSSK
jgi:pimeloyl-ACP methyl ester carboxylesterase